MCIYDIDIPFFEVQNNVSMKYTELYFSMYSFWKVNSYGHFYGLHSVKQARKGFPPPSAM